MSWTQSDIDALDTAIKKGVRRVSYQSGSVEYHSLDEMLKLRDIMQREVGGTAPVTRVVGAYDSGLSHGFLIGNWRNNC
jgi:hypothetical protein